MITAALRASHELEERSKREKRDADAARQRRSRASRRQHVTPVTPVTVTAVTLRDSTTPSAPEPAHTATAFKNGSTAAQQPENGTLFPSSSTAKPTEVQQGKEEQVEACDTAKPKKRGAPLPNNFKPSDKHYELAEKIGMTRYWADDCCEAMRSWARAEAHRPISKKSDWDQTLLNWIRKTGPPPRAKATPRPNSKEESSEIQRNILRSFNPVPKANGSGRGEGPGAAADGFLPL